LYHLTKSNVIQSYVYRQRTVPSTFFRPSVTLSACDSSPLGDIWHVKLRVAVVANQLQILLSTRPVVTFPAKQITPLAATKSYCLVTEAHDCKLLAKSYKAIVPSQDSNLRPVSRKSGALPIAPPRHLTLSTPAVPNCCCSKGSVPYWSNPPFLISDIRALWRSGLSARAPKCQKLKMVG